MALVHQWSLRLLALAFGTVFLYAGVMKAKDPGLFLISVRSFQLLPDPYAAWVALALPWLEIFAGTAVIIGLVRQGGALLLNIAIVGFIIGIGLAWFRGIDIDCGCLGGAGAKSNNYGWLIARDVVLLAMGNAVMWLEGKRAQ